MEVTEKSAERIFVINERPNPFITRISIFHKNTKKTKEARNSMNLNTLFSKYKSQN